MPSSASSIDYPGQSGNLVIDIHSTIVAIPTPPSLDVTIAWKPIFQVESYVKSPWKHFGLVPRYRLGEYALLLGDSTVARGFLISDFQALDTCQYSLLWLSRPYTNPAAIVAPPGTPVVWPGAAYISIAADKLYIEPDEAIGTYRIFINYMTNDAPYLVAFY